MELRAAISVVTGGGSGLGEALVNEIAQRGGLPVVIDLRADRVERSLAVLRERGVAAAGWACNVAERDQVKRVFSEIAQRLGRVICW